MRTSLTISSAAHAGLLLWGLVSFGAKPFDAVPTDSLPVDIISADQFSKLTKGQRNAPKVETQKPLAEKVGETKPVETLAKAVDKKEIVTASAEPPPTPQSKPEAKPADSKKEPEPKVDPIAEALKKEEAQKPPKPDIKPAPVAAQKPVPPQPKFNPRQIAALLDKRDPQRQVASADAISSTPSLGVPNGRESTVTQSELDALRRQIGNCWSYPLGRTEDVKVLIRVAFRRDGSIAEAPVVMGGTASPFGPAVAESAKRAILRCQPYKMLRPETYDLPQGWKEIDMTFDPSDFMQ